MKICSYNLENLYIGLEKHIDEDLQNTTELEWATFSSSVTIKNKPLFKINLLAKVFQEINADIFCVQEVMGKESLDNFNQHFLKSAYHTVLVEQNSNRSIYVGYLIRKGIDFKIHDFSHNRMKDGYLPSRNVTALEIVKDGSSQLIVIGVHLKSKRTDDKKTNTYHVREQEIALLGSIYDEVSAKFSSPVIIMGDLNANYNLEPEFHHLKKRDFFDFIKLKHPENFDMLGTFTANYLKDKISRLDFILLEKKSVALVDLAESGIYSYINEYGDNISLPFNLIEKKFLPSDHCPIYITIRL
jgi:endonuclease/exonuclease/phosphatase family metal-dependent hydrolase